MHDVRSDQSGGTKTEAVIASSSRGIVARGVGGTGNMAEVRLSSPALRVCLCDRSASKLRRTCALLCQHMAVSSRASIISTVLHTISQLNAGSGSSSASVTKVLLNGYGTTLSAARCPKVFGDVWIGVSGIKCVPDIAEHQMSGCDSPADQRRLSEAVSPFLSVSAV